MLSHTLGEENAFRNHVLAQFKRLRGGECFVSELLKYHTPSFNV